MKLNPIRETGCGRRGTLNTTYYALVTLLGEPNVTDLDDPYKVEASWGFENASDGRKAFIWCYRESKESCVRWSCDGDMDLLYDLFGCDLE